MSQASNNKKKKRPIYPNNLEMRLSVLSAGRIDDEQAWTAGITVEPQTLDRGGR